MYRTRQKKHICVLFALTFYFLALYPTYAKGGSVWDSFVKEPNQNTYIKCSEEVDSSLLEKYDKFKSPTYITLTKKGLIWKILDLTKNGNIYAANLTLQFYPLFWGNAEMHEHIDIYLGKLINATSGQK